MILRNKISIACATRVSMNVSVVCPIIELFCSVGYEQGWVNDSVTSLFQMNAYVLVQSLSHTHTCIIPEYVITVQLSLSEFGALIKSGVVGVRSFRRC